jgi:2-methylcitrate dehydratase PrpD
MTKRLHAGHAAQAGVIAGLLAARGFTGSADALEAPFGGFLQTFGDGGSSDPLREALGQRWEILNVGFKAYPACASAHTIIDGLNELMRRGLTVDSLEKLTIRLGSLSFRDVGTPYRPAGVGEAQMSGYYAAAVKLIDGDVFIAQYRADRLADPRILDLITRITIECDPELDKLGIAKRQASHLRAVLVDGRTLEVLTEYRKGSAEVPLEREAVIRKFRRTAGSVLRSDAVLDLEQAILGLEGVRHIDRISNLLSEASK